MRDARRRGSYDLIGDVHGDAGALRELLEILGYRESDEKGRRAYRNEERTAVFVGDLIDRGPRIAETLALVRAMVEAGAAHCVLGNHEWNALGWGISRAATPGRSLREHSHRNWRQHQATLHQLSTAELASHLAWFRTLPFALDLPGLRVVHACWDRWALETIGERRESHGGITDAFLIEGYDPASRLHGAIEKVLKGPEASLPPGASLLDRDGTQRFATRLRWYAALPGQNLRSYSLPSWPALPELPLPVHAYVRTCPYPADAPPVFFGHYCLDEAKPAPLARNVACLDYGAGRGGSLCAYRFSGEASLDAERFLSVSPAASLTFAA